MKPPEKKKAEVKEEPKRPPRVAVPVMKFSDHQDFDIDLDITVDDFNFGDYDPDPIPEPRPDDPDTESEEDEGLFNYGLKLNSFE